MQKAPAALPEGYCEILRLNLQKDKKTALLVNGLALLIMAAMLIPVLFLVPAAPLFDLSDPPLYFLRWGVLLAGAIAYIILHEWTHGFAMGRYGTSRVKYGFTLMRGAGTISLSAPTSSSPCRPLCCGGFCCSSSFCWSRKTGSGSFTGFRSPISAAQPGIYMWCGTSGSFPAISSSRTTAFPWPCLPKKPEPRMKRRAADDLMA